MMKAHDAMIRCFALCCLLALAQPHEVSAQNNKGTSSDNCNLDEAKRWYEEGNLDQVESIEDCAKNPKSMSSEKRLEAFELITESYLYRNNIGAADRSFQEMLRINPLYQPDMGGESQESYDLIYLSKTYSRRPIFSMYFGAGVNYTLVEQLENYGVDNTSGVADHEGYRNNFVIGINGSIGFELPLLYNFDLTLDATFGYRTYAYADSLYMSVSSVNPTSQTTNTNLGSVWGGQPVLYSTLTFKENQYWIDVPLMLRYNITTFDGFLPYVYAGAAANFLMSADLQDVSRSTTAETGIRDKSVPTKTINITNNKTSTPTDGLPSMRTMVNVSFVAGAGMKFRLGRNFLFADVRYTRMFLNAVNIDNRYNNPELLYNYAHVDNDYRMDNFALTVGFIKSFYVPRKKHQYNPLVINSRYNKWLERERNYIKKETDEDLKRELNSAIKDMELERPSLIEDVQMGKARGDKYLDEKKRQIDDIKNKRVRVEVKYE